MDSGRKEIPGSGGAIGRAYCDKLFRLERKWKELSPVERKKNRLIYSVPVLEAFFEWAETTRTLQENLRKALNYTLNHKKYLTNFLLDGRIPLSNNLSEVAVKPVAAKSAQKLPKKKFKMSAAAKAKISAAAKLRWAKIKAGKK